MERGKEDGEGEGGWRRGKEDGEEGKRMDLVWCSAFCRALMERVWVEVQFECGNPSCRGGSCCSVMWCSALLLGRGASQDVWWPDVCSL